MTAITEPRPSRHRATAADHPADRLLTGAGGALRRHHEIYGARARRGRDLIDLIAAAGLTGRGGAAFPVARKIEATAQAARRRNRPIVVANGAEGEPLSGKDAVLLRQSPHLVLDGLAAVAEAVGAQAAHLCVPAHRVDELAALVAERAASGWDRTPVTVTATAGRFVDGETTAIVDLLSGGPGLPRNRMVPSAVRGVGGRPTLVQNVETLAHVALIARNGAAWFRGRGTAAEPGTALVTLSGRAGLDGVVETDLGTPLAVMLRRISVDPTDLRAVLVGGFHGTWVDGRAVPRLALSARSLSEVGASPGAGVFSYLMRGERGLPVVAEIVGHLARESAGQCGPCRFGMPALAEAMAAVAAGAGAQAAHRAVTLADTIDGRGACSHPDGTAHMVRSALAVFADEVAAGQLR
ncbi:NADH-ubiquinone oxidoreductase-F iron-sulfur binding region domain-containing protein [Williamsia herbipolensis]|uniref:NADH-ubiquinone oxidoreductase-F iron-sulfur binding region domain-containing protein n=1 Tax=Williamsia herbipolensis TaxID=1603258 RepID=UPI0009E2D91A|nr:NADH-ubiquinone oxidoreductase-F iron-sulfur binding region domain-containing protein [Williamsia herbipolensis]